MSRLCRGYWLSWSKLISVSDDLTLMMNPAPLEDSMDSLVVDVVEVNVILGADMRSLRSCFAVNNSNLAVVEVFERML